MRGTCAHRRRAIHRLDPQSGVPRGFSPSGRTVSRILGHPFHTAASPSAMLPWPRHPPSRTTSQPVSSRCPRKFSNPHTLQDQSERKAVVTMTWKSMAIVTVIMVGTWTACKSLPLRHPSMSRPGAHTHYCPERATLYLTGPEGELIRVGFVGPREAREALSCAEPWRYVEECLTGQHPVHRVDCDQRVVRADDP